MQIEVHVRDRWLCLLTLTFSSLDGEIVGFMYMSVMQCGGLLTMLTSWYMQTHCGATTTLVDGLIVPNNNTIVRAFYTVREITWEDEVGGHVCAQPSKGHNEPYMLCLQDTEIESTYSLIMHSTYMNKLLAACQF